MHKNQDTVLGHLYIKFHDIDTHTDHRLNGRNGVLRIIPPVSTMRSHHNIIRIRIINLVKNLVCAGIKRLLLSARVHQKCYTEYKSDVFDITGYHD